MVAELAEVAEERQRIHAVAQDVRTEAQRDVPRVAAPRRSRSRLIGPGGSLPDPDRGRRRSRSRRLRVRSQPFEERGTLGREGGVLGHPAGRHLIHQELDVVATGEQQRDQVTRQLHLAAPDRVEDRLDHMGERHHMVQVEETGRPLDGVGGAEDGVDGLGEISGRLDLEQAALHVLEHLAALDDEGLNEVVEVHEPVAAAGEVGPGVAASAGDARPRWPRRLSSARTSSTAGLIAVKRSSCCRAAASCLPSRST